MCVCVYIYIYIYIYIHIFLKKNTKDGLLKDYKFISILFYVSDVNQKHEEKYNRPSSDLIDEINQNRHGERGGKGVKNYLLVFLLPFFYFIYFIYFYLSNFTVGWNYGNLTFLFIFFFC